MPRWVCVQANLLCDFNVENIAIFFYFSTISSSSSCHRYIDSGGGVRDGRAQEEQQAAAAEEGEQSHIFIAVICYDLILFSQRYTMARTKTRWSDNEEHREPQTTMKT